MNICENMLKIRESKGITRKELADALNVSLATITRYEKGDREPNIETLNKISVALGVNISQLLGISSELAEILGEKIIKNPGTMTSMFSASDLLNDYEANPNSPLRNNNILLIMLLNNLEINNALEIELGAIIKMCESVELKCFMEYLVYKYTTKVGE